jgi:hypothetical protein
VLYKIFQIAPHFYPMSFAQNCSLFTHIVVPKESHYVSILRM